MKKQAWHALFASAIAVPAGMWSLTQLDLRRPVAELSAAPLTSGPVHAVDVSITASDNRGIAAVWVSLNGLIASGRTAEPHDFRLAVSSYPVEVCALVDDTSGNAAKSCQVVEHPAPPGGCVNNTDCTPSSLYCAKAAGDCAGIGSCAPRPQACPDVDSPVCGCDGRTYDNACVASRLGVNVASGVCG